MSSLDFHKLTMRNFMSYGNSETEVDLDRGYTILIHGVNLDDTVNGIGANGVGKSTIINALVYAVYGTPLGSIKLDNIVNDINKKNCVVSITFTIGGHHWKIVRHRKVKAGAEGTFVEVFKDNDPKNLAKATLPETNKWIAKLVGLPLELFIRLVTFDADEPSFFKLKAADQRDIMENLFILTMLSERAEIIKEDQKDTTSTLSNQENKIAQLEREITKYGDAIVTAKKRISNWQEDQKDELDDYKSKLVKLNEIDVEQERKLFDAIDEVAVEITECEKHCVEVKAQIATKTQEMNHLDSDMRNYKKTYTTHEQIIHDTNSGIERIKEEIKTLQENICPECKQPMPDVADNITERETTIKTKYDGLGEHITAQEEAGDSYKLCETKYKEHDNKHQRLQKTLNELNSVIKQIEDKIVVPFVKSREVLGKIESQKETTVQKIDELDTAVNPHTDAFNELQDDKPCKVDYTEINELTTLLEHQKFMVKLLTDKKSFIRKNLINKRLPYLNERLTYYLSVLGLPQRVEFQSDLTPKITRRGNPMDFGNLSHGQKARVNFALSFAFRDVLERLHHKINVCLLDEVLDKALCDVGANSAVTMINDKARLEGITMFVITHKRELANRFDHVMTVKLENGFSSIE